MPKIHSFFRESRTRRTRAPIMISVINKDIDGQQSENKNAASKSQDGDLDIIGHDT